MEPNVIENKVVTESGGIIVNKNEQAKSVVLDNVVQQKLKRKHRRGKHKPKNSNWKFQPKYNNGAGGGGNGGGGGGHGPNQRQRSKLIRSNSLAPYNTNRFLMEEHMVEVPLLGNAGRTRDSSFSVDSEDNYFYSLPEDEEDFLTKEFSNVYEKARVERLENLSKQELIQECLQMEDRFTTDQGTQSQINIQRITTEFMSRIRALEQKIKELTLENYNLRCQVMRSNALAALTASPPSAAAPVSAATQPVPMESSSEDTESDSSSSSSSSNSSSSSSSTSSATSSKHRRSSNASSHSGILDGNEMLVDSIVLENQVNEQPAQENSFSASATNDCDGTSTNSNSGFLSSPQAQSIKSPLSTKSDSNEELPKN